MLTQCGLICDVCGNYVLPFINESGNPFRIKGVDQDLHACDKCFVKVKDAFAKKDWTLLPEGRLRKCFEENYKPTT